MGRERQQQVSPETDGVLVQPIGGQIYLIEEKDLEAWSRDEPSPPNALPLSGLIRH